MVDVPCRFVRLRAKCDLCDHWKLHSSMVYATIKNFSHVRSMWPVICIHSFVCDGSMWEPVLITHYSNCLCIFSLYYLNLLYFASWYKIAKMSLSTNRSSAPHGLRYMLFVMAWLQVNTLESYLFTYSTVIYVLFSLFSEEGNGVCCLIWISLTQMCCVCECNATGLLMNVLLKAIHNKNVGSIECTVKCDS